MTYLTAEKACIILHKVKMWRQVSVCDHLPAAEIAVWHRPNPVPPATNHVICFTELQCYNVACYATAYTWDM